MSCQMIRVIFKQEGLKRYGKEGKEGNLRSTTLHPHVEPVRCPTTCQTFSDHWFNSGIPRYTLTKTVAFPIIPGRWFSKFVYMI